MPFRPTFIDYDPFIAIEIVPIAYLYNYVNAYVYTASSDLPTSFTVILFPCTDLLLGTAIFLFDYDCSTLYIMYTGNELLGVRFIIP